jgi:hypothetical protein
LVSRTTRIVLTPLERALFASCPNHPIYVPECEPIRALFPRSCTDSGHDILFWRDRLDEIPNAHDDYLGLTAFVNDEASILRARTAHNLAELRSRGQRRNDFG